MGGMFGNGEGSGGRREILEVRVEGVSRSWNNLDDVVIVERNVTVSLARHEDSG